MTVSLQIQPEVTTGNEPETAEVSQDDYGSDYQIASASMWTLPDIEAFKQRLVKCDIFLCYSHYLECGKSTTSFRKLV